MKTIRDPANVLSDGFAKIRHDFQLPDSFPSEVEAAAQKAVARTPNDHTDRTAIPFVTLDPASSTDLDQAFAIERNGADLLLRYAIADVSWFVTAGDPIDNEAWKRGTSQYLPDGKTPLYPPILSEKAASLLPDGPRPAVIFTVAVDPGGEVRLQDAERAIIRNRAKLAYETVQDGDLPNGFVELSERFKAAEDRRGASRLDPPEQEVEATGDHGFELRFRPRLVCEDRNASLSLATNIAIAEMLLRHETGLFRVMAGPDEKSISRLRQTASAFELDWPDFATLTQFERTLDPANPRPAAFMLAVRRAGARAAYAPFSGHTTPWHAAIGAPYVHATAPLRRLADRYVIEAALAISRGKPVPETASEAFLRLPPVMARADGLGGRIESAVIDLAEAAMLRDRVGEIFEAVVTDLDERGARIQLKDLPVVARVNIDGLAPGGRIAVTLTQADIEHRRIAFTTA
jgi:exoribonuclease R